MLSMPIIHVLYNTCTVLYVINAYNTLMHYIM